MAGFHEVIYDQNVKDKVKANLEENKNGGKHSLWRISSTLFGHLRYDVDISPLQELKHLHNEENIKNKKYPKMTSEDKVMEELRAINLAS